jgi:hypothetical protein
MSQADSDTPADAPETTSNRCECHPNPVEQETLGTTHARPSRSERRSGQNESPCTTGNNSSEGCGTANEATNLNTASMYHVPGSKAATGTRAAIGMAKSQTTIRKHSGQGGNSRNYSGDATLNNRGRGTKTSTLPGTRREPETAPITPILR